MVMYYLGEHQEALRFYENALEIRQELFSPTHADIAKTNNWIGITYGEICEYKKELLSHEKALEIQQQSLPSYHLDLAKSYNNIGILYG